MMLNAIDFSERIRLLRSFSCLRDRLETLQTSPLQFILLILYPLGDAIDWQHLSPNYCNTMIPLLARERDRLGTLEVTMDIRPELSELADPPLTNLKYLTSNERQQICNFIYNGLFTGLHGLPYECYGLF